jgi:hypothetical protein
MYRGLYVDNYSIFKNGTPPTTATGTPLGTLTFSDEYKAYLSDVPSLTQKIHNRHFGGQKAPHHFSLIIDLRCNSTTFANTQQGHLASLALDRICKAVFKHTPLVRSVTSRCKADLLLALSLEGDESQQAMLASAFYLHLGRFPHLLHAKEQTTVH